MGPSRGLGWLALGALCLALGACNVIEGEEQAKRVSDELPAHGDTFILATIGDITALIPNITSDAPSHEVGALVYDGLVQADRNLNYVPQLAESWTFSEDCLSLTFALRRDVTWHDGRPFTADDVVFTYHTMMNPKTPDGVPGQLLHDLERGGARPVHGADHLRAALRAGGVELGDGHPAQAPAGDVRGQRHACGNRPRTAIRWAPGRTASTSGGAGRRSSCSRTATTTMARPTSGASCTG